MALPPHASHPCLSVSIRGSIFPCAALRPLREEIRIKDSLASDRAFASLSIPR